MRVSHIASAAIVLAPMVQATGIRDTAPPCTDKYKPFVSVGCFSDDDSSALPHRSSQDQSSMTVEQCTAECKSNGYRYAGLKYWGECYCGSALTADTAAASQCSSPCTGDSSKTCGGNGYLSVYQDPTFATDLKDTTTSDYVSLGCHTDSSSLGRAFPYQIAVDESTMDTKTCLEACRSRGYPYAGTEYAHECWCGTVLYDDTALVDDSQCNMPCEGKTSEMCGGSSRLSLYVDKKLLSSEPCGYKEPEPEPTTTTTAKATSTTTTALCTATVTVPPTCEFSCGKWCAPPLPDWKDQSSCLSAAKSCALQVASCFKTAGWPSALECFEFSQICSDITTYCHGSCKGKSCSKQDCWSKNKPGNAKPTTSKSVFPCSATAIKTSTTAKPTATACPPEPTNICTQPSNSKYGYGPGKPVGGIELPVVGCNDVKEDFSKKPFKLYNNADSRTCPSFSWGQRPDVCADACYDQYEDCRDTYVKSCGNQSWRNNWHKRDAEASPEEGSLEARTWGWGGRGGDDYSHCAGSDSSREWAKSGCDDVKCWGKGGNSQPVAEQRCKAQYKDCLAVNKRVNPGNSCKTWCQK